MKIIYKDDSKVIFRDSELSKEGKELITDYTMLDYNSCVSDIAGDGHKKWNLFYVIQYAGEAKPANKTFHANCTYFTANEMNDGKGDCFEFTIRIKPDVRHIGIKNNVVLKEKIVKHTEDCSSYSDSVDYIKVNDQFVSENGQVYTGCLASANLGQLIIDKNNELKAEIVILERPMGNVYDKLVGEDLSSVAEGLQKNKVVNIRPTIIFEQEPTTSSEEKSKTYQKTVLK